MREKIEAEQFKKKLESLNRDIASLQNQQVKIKKKADSIEQALSEKLEKRNSLIISYIAEPLGDKEVDFRQAKYLRSQLEKGNFELDDIGTMKDVQHHEEILEDKL